MSEVHDSRAWLELLRSFAYSAWENRVEPATGKERILRTPAPRTAASPSFQLPWRETCQDLASAPYSAADVPGPRVDRIMGTSAGPVRVPNRLDAADFGNELVYCAMGSYGVEDRPDLSRFIKLCGPDKEDIPLSPPHYDLPGGPVYRRIDTSKILLFGWNGRLFRDGPRQRQRRVRDTAVWVTDIEADGLTVTMVDFAPLGPSVSLVCRLFIVQNTGRAALSPGFLDQELVADSPSLTSITQDGGLRITDSADATGMYLRSSAPVSVVKGPGGDVDARLPLPSLGPGESAVAWSVLVPLLSAGHPVQAEALAALPAFDPWQALQSTVSAWRAWSSRTRFECDDPLLEDLVNGLAQLLKVHEGRHGLHLGTTYQRPTHCWIRDNYLMQRGLWAAGRSAEAERDVRAFLQYWRLHGPAWGYHVASRRSWMPKTTAELCSYLVLMVREPHANTGAPPNRDLLSMVRSCADAMAFNAHGLAGFDGDEAWFWELDPRLFQAQESAGFNAADAKLSPADFSVLENCWLSLAALTYAAEVEAGPGGDPARAARLRERERALTLRVDELMWDPGAGRYSSLLFPDGSRYAAPLVSGHCTPWYWGISETRPGSFAAGVDACERELTTAERILRGNVDTDVFAGLTPSFHLHALACIGDGARVDRALPALLATLPSSGAAWEYAAIDCPITGTDKRRGLDSGVLLAALLRATVGLDVTLAGFTLRPHLPATCTRLAFGDVTLRGRTLRVDVDAGGARVDWDGARYTLAPGEGLRWDAATSTVS